MSRGGFVRFSRPVASALILAAALVATSLSAAPASTSGSCTDAQKPVVFPEDQLQRGMEGTAYTVVEGQTPEPFDVEILGILPDAILPGFDLILVKLSGPLIDETGGIAFGMSGSPVYIDDKLVGSLSFSFGGDFTIAAISPAQQMVDLFDYPPGSGAPDQPAMPSKIHLNTQERHVAAQAAGVSDQQFPSTGTPLRLPVGVSGLNDRAIKRLQKYTDKLHLNLFLYRGGAAPRPTEVSAQPLEPGDAVAAVVSYGDLAFPGIGTVTATCGDELVAFGHWFFLDGGTTLGMNGADIVTTVKDPVFGAFKVGNVAEAHGVVDQDRFHGIRGIEGTLPPIVPVTSDVSNPDLGTSRSGETDIVKQGTATNPLLPFLGAFHLLANQDSVFDRIGDGTDSVAFILQGTRENGDSWTLTRQNMVYSPYDASFEGIFELLGDLYAIQSQQFEDVSFSSIHAEATITQAQKTTEIKSVLVSTPEHPRFEKVKRIRVHRGDRIRLKVGLLPFGETQTHSVTMEVQIPDKARGGGNLVVTGGSGGGFFFFGGGGGGVKSFDDLLAELSNADHGYDLIAQLYVPGVRGDAGKVVKPQSAVVIGFKRLFVQIIGQGGKGGGGGGIIVCKPGCGG